MKLKHRLGDFIAAIVVVVGVMLDLSHLPYGKEIFYAGFLLLAAAEVYYGIYLNLKNNEPVAWQSIVIPLCYASAVGMALITQKPVYLIFMIFAFVIAALKRNKLSTTH